MGEIDYRVGLDIGTNSIGWSVIRLRFNEIEERYEKAGIIDLGVRMFDKAEMPKTGASLAEPRRLARSARRRLSRRSQRKHEIRQLLVDHQIIKKDELDNLYPLPPGSVDIWDIRIEALDRLLSRNEWVRLLIHLSQRRGFKSNRKSEAKDTETGQVLSSINANQQLLSNYRTVGEMWMKDEKFTPYDKRHNSQNEYIFNVSRFDLQQEIVTLFNAQRQFNSDYASESLQDKYLDIWGHQLPFASGDDILKKVGYCSIEQKEQRIPKATYSFQYFTALDKLNNLRFGEDSKQLSWEQCQLLLHNMFERTDYFTKKNIPKLTYSQLRNWLSLDDEIRFNGIYYESNEEIKKAEDKEFISLKAYYEIRKIISHHSDRLQQHFDVKDYDTFGYALTVFKNDKDIRSYLQNNGNLAKRVYDPGLIEELLNLSYSKFGHLSFKALSNLLPIMESGKTFREAADELKYDLTGLRKVKRSRLLPVIPNDITNPIVKRALSQTRKVVNAIIKRYGSPLSLHIELARELSKDHTERRKIHKEQDENNNRNNGAIKTLIDFGVKNPTGFDIVRYKLWKEQNEKCAYSLRRIPAETFFAELRRERGSAPILDVDHILPYSQSFMDSYQNKVLVYSDENRKKGNKIPYEYLSMDPKRWEDFETFVHSNKDFRGNKKKYLLKKEYSPREMEISKERHLNDTRYATRYFKNFVEQTLLFKESKEPSHHKRVQTVNGKITSHFRSRWGLVKVRQETHLHHALDAVVVACTDQNMVNRVTKYYQNKENPMKSKEPYFPWPWEGFRDELLNRINKTITPEKVRTCLDSGMALPDYMIVSRMPKRSVTGAAHKETIMMCGGKEEKTGKTIIVKRVALKEIKFDKNGDFEMVGKDQDTATYEAIKQRYLEYEKDATTAFVKPLYKPCKEGIGNPIKKVKVKVETKSFVREVNGGVANNGDLVRIDIFQKDGKYSMVPVYVMDTTSLKLPNKIVTPKKGYDLWTEIDSTFQFHCSIHPYDLIRVKNGKIDEFYYFATIDISNNVVECIEVNTPNKKKISLSGLHLLEKYEVGILGDLALVKSEKRKTFQQSKVQKVLN
ncbi:type II CRISPR RNA-guided endonuclease Cas9 [Fredinandcohnia quinoae]|uniref:CRISPR-associated endonuclease Cas9 n=1 Tax=Fredinandcohnia quinoae TaxID=2918902 RepID=A0AAW5E920_9BACI|nr:type II CRISPR RNA-guided endonuclease Cas9 [Fredinandcohnia sp. SECRCQ15]MCH1627740.1 type II CRISPR RNA-guided endonuclease Cas9 [Fredinandcohnia sp. SECRCQ15]